MISGKGNLLAWFSMQGKPYFSIFRKGSEKSGNPAFTNKGTEGESVETGKAYLDKCLSLISTGDFFIYCTEDGEKTSGKGRSETFFSISMNDAQGLQQQTPAVSGTGSQMFDYETMLIKSREMAREEFVKLKTEDELKAAKETIATQAKEIKELEKNIQDPWNKVIKEVHPYIPQIIQGFGFGNPERAVSGVKEDTHVAEVKEFTEDQQQQMNAVVNNFCEALAKQYPETWLQILQRLTNTVVNDPKKIDLALNFL